MLELVVVAMVLALALLAAAATAPLPARSAPRRRRTVGPHAYALARRCGFRPSYLRNALVLRGVGHRWGPVLRLRDDVRHRPAGLTIVPRSPVGDDDLPAPTRSAASRDEAARTIDVVCMPLPRPHRAHRLWQLTAVELESGFVWAELTRTRGEPPLPRLAARFVRDVRQDLEARGLRLGAVVVRSGGTQRWPQLGANECPVPLRRRPPGTTRERLAANMHERILDSFWDELFAQDEIGSLAALRHELDGWIRHHNELTSVAAAGTAAD